MKMQSLTLLALICFAACAHTTAATGVAAQVVVLQARAPENCFDLGPVDSCAAGSLWYGDVLQEQAQQNLQAKAASLGATHLRVLEVTPSAHESRAFGRAYRCAATPVAAVVWAQAAKQIRANKVN
ncbi:MAG: hypothetical protein EOO40_08020, partial [Deltaproteobacteria bacterium]